MFCDPYLRWSDPHQKKGSSLSRQTTICEGFASELGWSLCTPIVEDGFSAFSGANLSKGKLGEYERAVRRGEKIGRALMVERMDRLTRREGFDALRWFGDMVECGLTIAIADVKMVVDKHSIRNQQHQLRAILDEIEKANAYSKTLSKRILPAWDAMRNGKTIITDNRGQVTRVSVVGALMDVTRVEVAKKGKPDVYWLNELEHPLEVGSAITEGQVLGVLRQKVHTESTCPAWLELIENRTAFRIRPDIAAVIERIFLLYVDTDLGVRGIAKLFNGEGVPVLRSGRCWHGSTIKALLKNRAVIGEYEHAVSRNKNGNVVAHYFPPIITNQLFQAANHKGLTRIKNNHSRTSRLRHLFSDVARCHHCHDKMTFITKRRTPDGRYDSYAYCQSAYLNNGCDQKKGLRMIPVEDTVLDNILTLALDDEHFVNEGRLPELRHEVAEKRRMLDDIRRRIESLLDIIGDPTFRRDERFDLRLRTAQNEEVAAKGAVEEADERLKIAQGTVSPQEHVRRVREIRADLWSLDESKGMDARRKVKLAINDLVHGFYVSAENAKSVLVLKGGVRHLMIDWKGKLLVDVPIWRERSSPADDPAVRAYFRRLGRQNEQPTEPRNILIDGNRKSVRAIRHKLQ